MKNNKNNLTPKILLYHFVGARHNNEAGADLYYVSKDNFKQQMEYLSQFINTVTAPLGMSPCITFDDGDISNYDIAFPVLRELKLKAYFFILACKIGIQGFMGWEQLKELQEEGMVIGSHGMTHRILTTLKDRDLDYELKDSKQLLEDRLGCSIDYLSIPRGFYNKRILEKARKIGYKAIFTSNPYDADGFKFGRISVKRTWGLDYFIRVVNDGISFKDSVKEVFKNSTKLLLGERSYNKVRSQILLRLASRKI